jgi:hypothetical protein
MSERIGETVPAPLRFELGQAPVPGEIARAVLLVTVGDDAAPRVAVLSPAEVRAAGDRLIRVVVRSRSTTAANLRRGASALLWCVLDAAAYSVCGTCSTPSVESNDPEFAAFDLTVRDVYRDFQADAPMVAPPTYRTPSP